MICPASAGGQAREPLPDRADQTGIVELDRAQSVHHPPYVVDRATELSSDLVEQPLRAGRICVDEVRGCIGLKRGAGQDRPDAVVKLPLESDPLGGGGLDRRRSGLLNLLAQGCGVECNGERSRDEVSVRRSASCRSRSPRRKPTTRVPTGSSR